MNEIIMLMSSASVAAWTLFVSCRIRNVLFKKTTKFDQIALYGVYLCGILQTAGTGMYYKEFHMTPNGGAAMLVLCFFTIVVFMEQLKKEKWGGQ